jgi:hypothetical protein
VIRDANGRALAYVYCRTTEAEAMQPKVLTQDEARRGRGLIGGAAVRVALFPKTKGRAKNGMVST